MALKEIIVRIISFVFVLVMMYIGYRIFFSIRKKQFEQQPIMALCPKCGSFNQQMRDIFLSPFGPTKYGCADCNYQGAFVEVEKEKIKDFISRLKKPKKPKAKHKKKKSTKST